MPAAPPLRGWAPPPSTARPARPQHGRGAERRGGAGRYRPSGAASPALLRAPGRRTAFLPLHPRSLRRRSAAPWLPRLPLIRPICTPRVCMSSHPSPFLPVTQPPAHHLHPRPGSPPGSAPPPLRSRPPPVPVGLRGAVCTLFPRPAPPVTSRLPPRPCVTAGGCCWARERGWRPSIALGCAGGKGGCPSAGGSGTRQ